MVKTVAAQTVVTETLGIGSPSVSDVGKSCGCDFQDEKRDGDCCDDLNGMNRVERKETNEETGDCYVPEVFVPVVPVTSTLTEGICTSTIIIDIGIDECQSNHSKSELSRGRHFPLEPEETYLLDVRLLSEDDCGELDFVCNVAAWEPAAPLRGVCREGILRQRVRSTAVLKKTVLNTIS
ncbi:hypothetical protein BgiBS90_002169, partial [Biomphalaria glabrata]